MDTIPWFKCWDIRRLSGIVSYIKLTFQNVNVIGDINS